MTVSDQTPQVEITDDAEIWRTWRQHTSAVTALFNKATTDPAVRAELMAEADVKMAIFPIAPGQTSHSDNDFTLLSAAATRLIPAQFQWEIVRGFGGGCLLTLKGIDNDPDA